MRFIYSKIFAIFFSCLILVVGLFFLQVKGYLDPVRNLFLQAPRPAIKIFKNLTLTTKSFFKTVFSLHGLVLENQQLKQKVFGLQQNLVDFEQQKKENLALRNELGFFKEAKSELVPCSILTRNALGISDSIVINCGSNQGAEEGRAIVSEGHIVGKITYVYKNTSNVLLATSSKFSADVKLIQSGLKSIIQGSYGSGLILGQLPQNEKVEKGWLVVTAGINEKIPKNYIFGEVGEILSSSTELFKKMTVISPIDFSNLDFVFIAK